MDHIGDVAIGHLVGHIKMTFSDFLLIIISVLKLVNYFYPAGFKRQRLDKPDKVLTDIWSL